VDETAWEANVYAAWCLPRIGRLRAWNQSAVLPTMIEGYGHADEHGAFPIASVPARKDPSGRVAVRCSPGVDLCSAEVNDSSR